MTTSLHALPSDRDSSSGSDVWTVQRVLTWSAGYLKDKCADSGPTNFRLDAELLLAEVLGCDRMRLYLQLDKPLSREERDSFKTLLRQRAEGAPIAYLLGYRDFYRHRFKVNASVLIPRPDTEILVEQSLQLIAAMTEPKILDVGTGSGCIAISLGLERPDAVVLGWDISEEALTVARENAATLATTNVTFLQQDVFHARPEAVFDLLVSNPPYIARTEESHLSATVREHEPHTALFDTALDGLSFYRLLAERSLTWLKSGGVIAVECGHMQAEDVAAIFQNAGLQELTITKDLAGHPRVVAAIRP